MQPMSAILQDRYGPPEQVLRLDRVPRPEAGPGAVLVRVHAVPVSGSDWHLIRGLPYLARPVIGLRRPRSLIQGLEFAGTIEAIGPDVTGLAPGDEVFGWCAGALAEYAAVPVGQVARRPANLSLTQSAAVPISAFTAIQGVRDRGRVGPGQRVLITGASGGVGSYAIQLAKAYGAEVTAVCGPTKMDLVRSLGADHVIDHTREQLTARGGSYDVLIDIYGNPSLRTCARLVRRGGTVVLIGGTGGRWLMGMDRWLRGLVVAPVLGFRARPLVHKDSLADLLTLRDLIEAGAVTPVVDRTFPLDRTAEAIRYVADRHARGQVLVTMPGSTP